MRRLTNRHNCSASQAQNFIVSPYCPRSSGSYRVPASCNPPCVTPRTSPVKSRLCTHARTSRSTVERHGLTLRPVHGRTGSISNLHIGVSGCTHSIMKINCPNLSQKLAGSPEFNILIRHGWCKQSCIIVVY